MKIRVLTVLLIVLTGFFVPLSLSAALPAEPSVAVGSSAGMDPGQCVPGGVPVGLPAGVEREAVPEGLAQGGPPFDTNSASVGAHPPTMVGSDITSAPLPDYQIFFPFITGGFQGYVVAPNGSDANPGTSLLPWKTIRKAARTVGPGATVYIRDGIYTESVSFDISGTEESPIRIMAFPGEHPTIDGGFAIPGYWGALLDINGNHIQVSGIEVRRSAYMGIVVYGNHDLVDDVYVHHTRENGILIKQGDHSTVQNSRVWRSALSNEYGQGGGWSSGLSAARSGVSYATIRNNIVWESWGEGISCYESDHTVIEGNTSHDNYSANLYISDSTNVLCQRNFVYRDPESYVYGYGSHGGIMMGDERYNPPSASVAVINNIAFGNRGNFHWWQGVQGGGMHDVLIANNTFVNAIGNPNAGQGGVIISRGDHQGVRFENNIVQQDGDLPVIATHSQPGIAYSHNLWSKTPQAAASGPGDIIGNPLLERTGAFDDPVWYHLTAASPAIGHALSIPEVLVDFFNLTRDSSPDMGAIEYVP